MTELKRYNVADDSVVKLTQEYFDGVAEQLNAVMSRYKRNFPDDFKCFCDQYFSDRKHVK